MGHQTNSAPSSAGLSSRALTHIKQAATCSCSLLRACGTCCWTLPRLWLLLQANQWRVARESGVEAVVAAMERFPMHPMVQLSALLCMIPLTLENAMMQVGCCL